jgi:hypothetical protein
VADSQEEHGLGADVRWSAPISSAVGFVLAAAIPVLGYLSGNAVTFGIGLVIGAWAFVDTGWFVAMRVSASGEVVEWRAPFRTIEVPRTELRGVSAGWLGKAVVLALQLADGSTLRVWRGPGAMSWLSTHSVEWLA